LSRRACGFETAGFITGVLKSAEGLGVSPTGTAHSADLGGSSNYSNENFED